MKCPDCKNELILDDTIDYEEPDEMTILITRSGICPSCKRDFLWYESYQFCSAQFVPTD